LVRQKNRVCVLERQLNYLQAHRDHSNWLIGPDFIMTAFRPLVVDVALEVVRTD
jgi:hypothetical protein